MFLLTRKEDFMSFLIQKINDKVQQKGSKKTLENLVVFVIILIVTIIFINYIWNGDKKKKSSSNSNEIIQNISNAKVETVEISNNSLERQVENILRKLDGVDEVSVLITYEETNRIVPMYNEDTQTSTTEEEDNQGGVRTINESTSKKEVVYEEENGSKKIVTSKVISPQIKGAIIMAKGANNVNVKTNIIQAVQAATGLPTHKIQVFEMK